MNIPSERINFPSVQYDENRLNITPYCYVKKNENEKKTFVLFIREKKSSATKWIKGLVLDLINEDN